MIDHESRKGNSIERVRNQSSGNTLCFRVGEQSIRVFCSDHTGGIMAEDGIAIPQKAYHRLRADRKSFIRVVAIQEKKFKDYALDEFG